MRADTAFAAIVGRACGKAGRAIALVAAGVMMLMASADLARAQAVVIVNGEPITNSDIDQRIKLMILTSQKAPPRKDVIEELINDKIKIKEAKKYGLDPGPSDIDSNYASMASRMRLSTQQLDKTLEGHGIHPQTLKSRMKAELVWGQLVRGKFQQSLMVGEKDILSAIEAKGQQGQEANSFEYHLRQIILIVPRGSASGVIDARRREAEALRARVQSCQEAIDLFRTMRDATVREPITKTSADLPVNLRDILDKTPVGKLTAPEVTKQGIEMVALCDRKPTTADTPQKREARDKLFAQKFETQAKKFLQEIRRSALIEYR
ncbi:MAG: peptidylprolyl isomerase [Xanthobacteraceae bacterium]|nr:MAG: peptidylprolyl isomerase [Xanthobacteraceae bacterium]